VAMWQEALLVEWEGDLFVWNKCKGKGKVIVFVICVENRVRPEFISSTMSNQKKGKQCISIKKDQDKMFSPVKILNLFTQFHVLFLKG